MKTINTFIIAALITASTNGAILYENNFQRSEVDKVPEEFMVLDGAFAVKFEEDAKFLELPGAPLDTYGVIFGPAHGNNIKASARFFGTSKGRRFPDFGLSINGQGGFRLNVSPAKKAVELFRGEELVKSVPLEWQSGKWTSVILQSAAAPGDKCIVTAKVWQEGKEPAAWMITSDQLEKPSEGRGVIWGKPFSGTPIRFDDVKLETLEENK